MTQEWAALSGRRRTLARQVYHRDRNTPGYLCPGSQAHPCGKPIDWDLPYKDPITGRINLYSKSVDHDIELQDGGPLTDLTNLWTTHLTCNLTKGASRRWQRHRPVRPAQTTITLNAKDI